MPDPAVHSALPPGPCYDTDDARWAAFARRDRAADGRFVCAVRTTGIYCRPSCPGRPKRENVRFFASNAAAEAAGFRACKRCRPERQAVTLPAAT